MTPSAAEPSAGKRLVSRVDSLSSLVGGHPDALREIFGRGVPADPAELGDAPRGRLLAAVPGAGFFLLTRPVFQALASDHFPWQGKSFDHGGNSGQNVVLGKRVLRFRAQVGPSAIDGLPALVLDYGAHQNPWPVRALVDELRMVGEGIAIGPAILRGAGGARPLFWFGLEARR